MSDRSLAATAARWLRLAEDLVGRAAPRLNALNLFPVPDSDTGSNMHATLASARAAAEEAADPASVAGPDAVDLGAVMARAGSAALDSARGNSGTLLAVALVGLAEPLRGRTVLDTPLLADAFAAADGAARTALSEPREGTLLTVLTAAATSLAEAADEGRGLEDAVTRMVADALSAVEDTESQLEPLTHAHVVDAGAVGLLWVLEALRAVATGTGVDADLAAALHGYADEPRPASSESDAAEAGVEVMATLRLTPLNAAALRVRLAEAGDALILAPVSREADAEGRVPWRVHVHVERAADALAVLESAGVPEGVTVTPLSAHEHDDGHHGR